MQQGFSHFPGKYGDPSSRCLENVASPCIIVIIVRALKGWSSLRDIKGREKVPAGKKSEGLKPLN